MLIATFGPGTGWVGKKIVYEGEQFILEDQGLVTAAAIMEYDRQGHLKWVTEGTRAWVGSKTRTARTTPSPTPSTPSGPDARGRLNKAREQFAEGKYRAAVDTLWYVEAEARAGDWQAAEGILELAPLLRDQTGGAARKECDALLRHADKILNVEMRLHALVGPLAVSFVPARFLGFQGRPQTQVRRQDGTLWLTSKWIGMGTPEGERRIAESVPMEAIACVEVTGGRVLKDTGELLGQYMVAGLPGLVLLGMKTNRTTVVVHARGGDAAVFQVANEDSAAVRAAVTPLLQSATIPFWDETLGRPPAATVPPSAIAATDHANTDDGSDSPKRFTDTLRGLAELHDRGALTDEEFATAKRRLLE